MKAKGSRVAVERHDLEKVLVEQSLAAHPKVGVEVSRPRKQNIAIVDVVFLWDRIDSN